MFKEVYDVYAEAGEKIFAEKNVSYRRSKDPFLRDDPYAFTEGIVKGWLQMKTGFKQADISQYHGEIGRNMGELNYLYSLSPDTQVVVAQESIMPSSLPRTPMSTVMPVYSPERKIPAKQRIDELERVNDNIVKTLVKKVGRVSEIEERLEVFRQPDMSLSLAGIFLSGL